MIQQLPVGTFFRLLLFLGLHVHRRVLCCGPNPLGDGLAWAECAVTCLFSISGDFHLVQCGQSKLSVILQIPRTGLSTPL